MAGLDTNVLVRRLVDDDARQSAAVGALSANVRPGAEKLLVPATVIPKLERVLRSRYRFDKPTVIKAFNALLETQEIEFENEALVEQALHLYREEATDWLTFDRGAAKMERVELLSF